MKQLDNHDRILLDYLQNHFPIKAAPFLDLAEQLGITEAEVISRVQDLKQRGVIRRIGAVLDARALGYHSTLCACRAEPGQLDRVAAAVSALPGVTHNYQRDHDYNLWFTVTAPTAEAVDELLQELQQETGVAMVAMPAVSIYKIDARFEMSVKDDR